MPTNEAEASPERLWLPLEAALLLRGDEHGPHEIEYVPASARDAVWEKAISIARYYREEEGDIADQAMREMMRERDAALSAGKESNG